MRDASHDPWANRHPEWAQVEAERHRRAARATTLRLRIGLLFLAIFALSATLVALRDHLPEGW